MPDQLAQSLADLARKSDGKMEPTSGDSLNFRIGHTKGRVIVDFGVNLSHLEMHPQDAENIAHLLSQHALLAKMQR